MKLHSLRMKGFGPFASDTRIDFEPFQVAPILLIHGRTGAGKTSVLDAITYALYGRASGMDGRTPDTLRSHMIDEMEETEVELVFQLRDDRYRASRSPEFMRKKRRGEGFVKESPRAVLDRWEGDHWSPLATRVSDVNKRIESLLGFSYDQFTQVLILPQGKFRQMLIADSMQRRDIFRQLFKTGDLEAMQVRMREDTSHMRKQIEEKKIRMDELLSQLCLEDGQPAESLEAAQADMKRSRVEIEAMESALEGDKETLKGIRQERDLAMQMRQVEESLKEWKSRIAHLNENGEAMKTLAAARDLADRALKIRGEQEAKDRAAKRLSTARDRLRALERQGHDQQVEWESLPHEEALQEEIRVLMERDRVLKEQKDLKESLNKNRRRLKTFVHHLDKTQAELASCEKEKGRLKERLEIVHQDMLKESAYLIGKDLEAGAPCPVCGSMHHPNLAEAVFVDPEEEKKLADGLDKVEKALAKKRDFLQSIELEYAEFKGFESRMAAQLASLQVEGDISETDIRKKLDACRAAIDKSRKVREKRSGIMGQISLAQDQAGLAKADADRLEAQWGKALEASGFTSEKAYDQAACSYEDLQLMNQTLHQYSLDLAEAKRQVDTLQLKLEQVDFEHVAALPVLDQGMQAWTEKIAESTKILAEKTSRLGRFEKITQRLMREQKDLQALEAEFGSLAWMADVASGRNSQGMDFEQFVLRRYLAEVLAVANERLAILTDGRYELSMQEERRDKRRRFGLDLDVFDFYTGDSRPVGSLSGGESFKASLALALGLSDAVRAFAGGIELETLFIDEGFGTLDPSSLDQAVEVLVELKQQNRMVGIISHVPELKERIDNRIEVVKNKRGSRIQIHLPGGEVYETMSVSNK